MASWGVFQPYFSISSIKLPGQIAWKPLLKSIKTITITLPSKPSLLNFSEMAYIYCGLIGFIKMILIFYHSPSSSLLTVYILIPLLLKFDCMRRKSSHHLQSTEQQKKVANTYSMPFHSYHVFILMAPFSIFGGLVSAALLASVSPQILWHTVDIRYTWQDLHNVHHTWKEVLWFSYTWGPYNIRIFTPFNHTVICCL